MVKLEEVPDEDFQAQQQGPKIEEDDWDTDSGMLHLLRIMRTNSLQNLY